MINRFKIWFNHNNYKIMTTVLSIIIVYAAIKGLNNFFKNVQEDEGNQQKAKSYISDNLEGEYLFEDKEDLETYQKVEKTDDNEYNTVENIYNNIINKVAKANNDNRLRQDLYNICADFFLDEMTSARKEPNEENILDYYPGVIESNINKYYIGDIYRFYQNGNVKAYFLEIRYNLGNNNYESNFMIIYVDYQNHTFSYGGSCARPEGINSTIDIESIDTLDGNTF